MKGLSSKDFFYCYDIGLSMFLKRREVRYILKAKSIKDNVIFTLYEKNSELIKLLNEYNELKGNR